MSYLLVLWIPIYDAWAVGEIIVKIQSTLEDTEAGRCSRVVSRWWWGQDFVSHWWTSRCSPLWESSMSERRLFELRYTEGSWQQRDTSGCTSKAYNEGEFGHSLASTWTQYMLEDTNIILNRMVTWSLHCHYHILRLILSHVCSWWGKKNNNKFGATKSEHK